MTTIKAVKKRKKVKKFSQRVDSRSVLEKMKDPKIRKKCDENFARLMKRDQPLINRIRDSDITGPRILFGSRRIF